MQLYLVNNDPTSTLLITGDGIPMFSIKTPKPTEPDESHDTRNGDLEPGSEIAQRQGKNSDTTTILRLESHYRCTGKLEVAIGLVVYEGSSVGTRVKISEDDIEIEIPPYHRMTRAINSSLEHEYDSGSDEDSNEGCGHHQDKIALPRNLILSLLVHGHLLDLDQRGTNGILFASVQL